MPTFGNSDIGDAFIHALSGDIWGSLFVAPASGYVESISAYLKCIKTSRVRLVLYDATERRRLRFIMSTEEKIVPSGFVGWLTLNFTAKPPITQGVKYWIAGWADEYGYVQISSKKTLVAYPSAEWTSYMAGEPHGLSYPRFYEIVPQGVRIGCLCSIFCTYDSVAPSSYTCPYCATVFPTYADVLDHIKRTPTEMIHLQICSKCGMTHYLKEELQLHMFQTHQEGTPPDHYSCIFCSLLLYTDPLSETVYKHINDFHSPFTGPAEGVLSLSFEETITIDVKVSKTIKRILSETEPTAPDGYERAPEYDLNFGIAGKSWAFVKKAA